MLAQPPTLRPRPVLARPQHALSGPERPVRRVGPRMASRGPGVAASVYTWTLIVPLAGQSASQCRWLDLNALAGERERRAGPE